MRRASDEERALFLAAMSGRMPVKHARAKTSAKTPAHSPSKKTAGHEPLPPARGRRRATPEEMDLFLFAVTGHTLIKEPSKPSKPAVPAPAPKAARNTVGLDGNTLRRLTRGELPPTAKLDLHGMTEAAAHAALTAFLLAAHRRGDRLVLVVTGKGSANAEPVRGVLKQMVPRWLEEKPMTKIIAEKRWAHRRHGGEGALYIYLRKQSRS